MTVNHSVMRVFVDSFEIRSFVILHKDGFDENIFA